MAFADFDLPREKVFRDPIHHSIVVDNQIILDLINTPEFQRLRRVKQLGTTSLTFHGAEHSRFGHCLGVYEIARQMCDLFARNYPQSFDASQRPVIICAALLHDLGHGPFSHTFEHIFHTDHEAITQRLITDPGTNVNQILRQVSKSFPSQVASVIDHTYPHKQVVQMISSQVDADRMDYLQRDAYYTGTNYGKFDLDRVLRSMVPTKDGIVFRITGMHAVEDYILSRMQMYLQIYFHPVSRSMEVVLECLLKRAKWLYQHPAATAGSFKPALLVPFFDHHFTLDDYLMLDDGVFMTYFNQWKHSPDKILSDLAHRFVDRQPFKSATYNSHTKKFLPKLRQIIAQAGYNNEFYTGTNDSFKQPYDTYNPHDSKPASQIELLQQNGDLVELSRVSTLVAAVTNRAEGDQRFFFPREMLTDTSAAGADLDLFAPLYDEFQDYLLNGQVIDPAHPTNLQRTF